MVSIPLNGMQVCRIAGVLQGTAQRRWLRLTR